MTKIRLRTQAALAAIALAAVLFAPTGHAQQGALGVELLYPNVLFDLNGTISYSVGGGKLTIAATPIAFDDGTRNPESGLPPVFIDGTPLPHRFILELPVDMNGNVVPGVKGTLKVIGEINDLLGIIPPACPVGQAQCELLTADIEDFGFTLDVTGTEFDFRGTVTGGALVNGPFQWFAPLSAIGIKASTEEEAVSFSTGFSGHITGTLGQLAEALQIPPVFTGPAGGTVTAEAFDANGAPVAFSVTATDGPGGAALPVTCNVPSGATFALGATDVTCTATSSTATTGTFIVHVVVRDTTRPVILVDPVVQVEATGSGSTSVVIAPKAVDAVSGEATLGNIGSFAQFSCDQPAESLYPIGDTTVTCSARDAALNATMVSFVVRVTQQAPEFPGGTCFVVDFREITYFKSQTVLSSSDAAIRTAAGITGGFNPAAWPYRATGGTGYTKSKGTQFRIYGFAPSQVGQLIPNADVFVDYPVKYDSEAKSYYIDLGGPGRVFVCPEQLHNYVLGSRTVAGNQAGSSLLPTTQRNVPGIMLTKNAQILKIPTRVRNELIGLGKDPGSFGAVSYVGLQLQGGGNAEFREFVDVEISFPGDSVTNRLQHFESGFHTAINLTLESFNGCNYLDSAAGNDAVRQRDSWGPNLSRYQGYEAWRACGAREPAANKKQRANYEVAANAVQIFPTVSVGTDTLSLFYGPIQKVTLTTKQKIELLLTNWQAWDLWDLVRR